MVFGLFLTPAFLLVSTTCFAHGGGHHLLNTTTAIDDDRLEVKTPRGEAVSVTLTKQARFKDRGNQASTELPRAGKPHRYRSNKREQDTDPQGNLFLFDPEVCSGRHPIA